MNGSEQYPHKRLNLLTGEWVLVSPHRTQRPWQGQMEKPSLPEAKPYDPGCYLCPGNPRAGGKQNPQYEGTFVFDNDFSALLPETPEMQSDEPLLITKTERGICRVGCFSPVHDLTVPRMDVGDLRRVVDMWAQQTEELGSRPEICHVQVFENRGEMMGASNPHPHCQIWANTSLPNEPEREMSRFMAYQSANKRCLLCDYLKRETQLNERIVFENERFIALVPFWAVWPFELLLVPRNHVGTLDELTNKERDALAHCMKSITTRYDNLFETSFPYSMGFHQRPTTGESKKGDWHMHAHYYPPLLRSATIRKFMVGYELLASPQRDITPETAAARLRALPEVHYLERSSAA